MCENDLNMLENCFFFFSDNSPERVCIQRSFTSALCLYITYIPSKYFSYRKIQNRLFGKAETLIWAQKAPNITFPVLQICCLTNFYHFFYLRSKANEGYFFFLESYWLYWLYYIEEFSLNTWVVFMRTFFRIWVRLQGFSLCISICFNPSKCSYYYWNIVCIYMPHSCKFYGMFYSAGLFYNKLL